MNSPLVRRSEAMKQQTHHQFWRGVGYLKHRGPPDLGPADTGSKNCAPPAKTKDGSMHILKPAKGAPPMQMRWVAAESAWAHPKMNGHRMAFSCEYLSKAGWEYLKAA